MFEPDYDILDLRDVPQFLDVVADRLWHAWWADDGHSMDAVQSALRGLIGASGYPFTLVAIRDGQFLGTVTSIMDDIHVRPDWGPCLAALWVEPEARVRGIAGAMTSVLMQRLAALGFERVYLSAKPKMRTYYLLRGWTMIDSDIDNDHQDVFVHDLPS